MNAEQVRAWFEARLDEDAQIVEIIPSGGYAPPVWRYRPTRSGRWVEVYPLDRTNDEPPGSEVDEGGVVALVTNGRWEHKHIVRHDPARVEREITAKRRRLERHRPELVEGIDETWLECTWCHTNQPWPCPDIIDDAQAYRDEPGFPAELRLGDA